MNLSQRLRACARHTGLDAVIELLQEAADEIDRLSASAALPTLRPGDSHMESLIEAAIQGHASTRDAMRWLVRQVMKPDQQPATPKPVGFTYQAEIEYAHTTGGNGSFWRVPPDLDDEAVPLYTHPAPSVPADVVRVPLQVLKDASEALGNFVSDHGWGDADMQAMDNLDAYIARHEANRAAMLAAKEVSACAPG